MELKKIKEKKHLFYNFCKEELKIIILVYVECYCVESLRFR